MEPTFDGDEAAGTSEVLFEVGSLRALPRTGWRQDGIPLSVAETVAEHSHRVAVIAATLAKLEGADPNRAALLGAFHDIPEARTGDLTPLTRRYVTAADPRKVVADQTAAAHPAVGNLFADAIAEFEEGTTLEARCAREADKLDCLLRAAEYRAAGVPAVQGKIARCRAALTMTSAQEIADAALAADPTAWQAAPTPR
ncbi:HD domain-containing protein [Kitasatospora griseola]|uniref:HD domain-containing protein n=1 Tax=Kitasatospora griseola TaxID=2064 RepID=UPI00382FAFCC